MKCWLPYGPAKQTELEPGPYCFTATSEGGDLLGWCASRDIGRPQFGYYAKFTLKIGTVQRSLVLSFTMLADWATTLATDNSQYMLDDNFAAVITGCPSEQMFMYRSTWLSALITSWLTDYTATRLRHWNGSSQILTNGGCCESDQREKQRNIKERRGKREGLGEKLPCRTNTQYSWKHSPNSSPSIHLHISPHGERRTNSWRKKKTQTAGGGWTVQLDFKSHEQGIKRQTLCPSEHTPWHR